MEIKEAIGYLQAVADNAQNTPKYQRALEMAIKALKSAGNVTREIILITDGEPEILTLI